MADFMTVAAYAARRRFFLPYRCVLRQTGIFTGAAFAIGISRRSSPQATYRKIQNCVRDLP